MHHVNELPAWERLLKKMVWAQLGNIEGKRILDFGSGQGITANHFAAKNSVVAIEPRKEMLENRWADAPYEQIVGGASTLKKYEDQSFDVILCHNVLEYIDDKEPVVNELSRVLKKGGILSIVKHNRAGRVMQLTVLLDEIQRANDLLDGKDGMSSQFGPIQYFENEMIPQWNRELRQMDWFGIRVFWDLQQNQDKHGKDEWQDQMMRLEMRVSQMDAYRNIAFFHHLLLTR